MDISIKTVSESGLSKVDFDKLEFGKIPTDHMFMANYKNGQWINSSLLPFQPFSLSPFALGLHYGQTVFEGMKAFSMQDGSVSIFRLNQHHKRFNRSLERMCMPPVPEELFFESLKSFVKLEKAWVPKANGSSLYIRPFMFASEAKLGVKISEEYVYSIVASPVQSYYSDPLKVKVEDRFARAVEGGTGYAKCGGNYGGAFYPTMLAKQRGFDQVLWTDGRQHKYIEESGTMNVMFVIDGTLVTPELTTSVLDGVTRNSMLKLATDMNIPIETRRISVDELETHLLEERLSEAFGAGTAAVVTPIKEITIRDQSYSVPVKEEAIMFRLKQRLADIRAGKDRDIFNWNTVIQ